MTIRKYPTYENERPHTVVRVDSSRIGSSENESEKALLVFGSAEGGIPGELYELRSYAQARQIFKAGELLDWIEMAWTPSETAEGAGRIYAMRVDTATNASLQKGPFKFLSRDYGTSANGTAVKLEQGSVPSSYKLTAQESSGRNQEVYDNLGIIFKLRYIGRGKEASAEIKNHALVVTVDGTIVKTYDLSGNGNFRKVYDLVDELAVQPDFEASMVSYGDKNIDIKYLDEAKFPDIKGSDAVVTSLAGDLINQLEYSSLIELEYDKSKKKDIELFPLTSLSGGSNGTVPNSWRSYFLKARDEDSQNIYYVTPVTPNPAIHAELRQIVAESSAYAFPMRAIVGGDANETRQRVLTRRSNLNSERMMLSGFDAEVQMGDGRIKKMPPYMTTALIAGIASGLDVGEPVTFKHIRVSSLLNGYTSDDLDTMFRSGVVVAEKSRNRTSTSYRIVGGVSTRNDYNDPVARNIALGEITDFLATDLRVLLDETYIGTRTTSASQSLIKATISNFLGMAELQRQIVDFDDNDIQVVIRGNNVNISFSIIPSQEIERITVNMIYRDSELASE